MKTKTTTLRQILCVLTGLVMLSGCTVQAETYQTDISKVKLLKTPHGGIQPQATLDSKGNLHLVYFKGQPMAGDLFYVRSTDEGSTFSAPLRVNSRPNSAIATGTIRGAQIAIGQDERVHVAWNGSNVAEPKGAGGTPMLYARLNFDGTAFEEQRNLITWAGGLDGGGTLAADRKGHVYVAWHAAPNGQDEEQRAIYLTHSTDNGQTFAREKKINPQPTGACGCCQMRAFVDNKDVLYVLYRAAGANVNRDSILLVSLDHGEKFESANVHPWNVAMCPMSSYSFAESRKFIYATWETKEQVYMTTLQPATTKFSMPASAPGTAASRKHPVIIANKAGEVLFAWTEGTGWNRGGSLAWQIYNTDGQLTDLKGRGDGVPVWGLLSTVARSDGGFILLY
jgi:hypothetical protein